MKTILICILLGVINTFCYSQESPEETFEKLLDQNKSAEILRILKDYDENELTSKALYYIGVAYFYEGSNNPAITFFDKAIQKGPATARMYYFNAIANKESGNMNGALENIVKATELDPENSYYLTENAEVLIELEKEDDAKLLLDKAFSMGDRSGKVYYYLSQYLFKKNNSKEALLLLQKAAGEVDTEDEFFPVILYNIAVIEFDKGDHEKSNEYLFEFVKARPDNYFVVPVIIQNYFAMNMQDSAKKYIAVLYSAHERNDLSEDMKEDFCFERFKWNDYNVYAYESFEKLDTTAEYQRLHKQTYIFYDKSGKASFTIQTERFNDFGMGNLNFDYVMGRGEYINDEYFHQTFGMLNLKEPVDYKKLKEHVLKILNNEVQPTSSSKSKDKND